MTVKIIGYGWVGKSMHKLFPDAVIVDPALKYDDYEEKCDVAFICVPTPNKADGSLDTSIVEEEVENALEDLIVIRSTVNPGTTDRLIRKTGKRVVMEPEYLGETPSHPMLDPNTRQFKVIGGEVEDRKQLIDLYTTVYNANISIRQVSALEAEVIKLSENRAIAWKVMQCLELYEVCEASGTDYYTVRDGVYGDDPRFNLWFTFVYPNNKGFHSSKCLRKDVPAWNAWAQSVGVDPSLTKALVEKSAEYEKD